jgi:hypothetical protein
MTKNTLETILRKIFDELNLKGYSSSIWLCWEKDMKTKELTEFAKRVNATVTNAEKGKFMQLRSKSKK